MAFDIEKIRKDFPILNKNKAYIYLDSAATTQKPTCVLDALYNFYLHEYATVHRAIYEPSLFATEKYDATRVALKEFLNAKNKEEIVFTRGTTDSINLVAQSYGRKFINESDEIIVTEMEHHSNLVPWQILCKEKNAVLKVIPINDKAELQLDEYKNLLSDKTKLVCVGHVANSTGTINPVKEIIKLAHEKGAKVLVDGAQSIAHMPVDVQDLDADFYAISGHKMYGPTGVGALYGKKELLESMPPVQGGGDMIERVTLKEATYQKPPLRFEAGTPTIAEVIAWKEAIDYLREIGMENIHKRELDLSKYLTEKMKTIKGLRIIGEADNKCGINSFMIEGLHPLDIGTLLDTRKVAIRTGHHCAQPTMQRFNLPATARASIGIYTTEEDIDAFTDALAAVQQEIR